jgi:hypothetical protein
MLDEPGIIRTPPVEIRSGSTAGNADVLVDVDVSRAPKRRWRRRGVPGRAERLRRAARGR